MKLITILVTLIVVFGVPSFSQNNTGGGGIPNLDGIPEDQPESNTSTKDPVDLAVDAMQEPKKEKGSAAQELKKKVAFIRLNHYAKKLIKEVNLNVVNQCHESDPKIIGFKTLTDYLSKRELSEMVKLNTINSGSTRKECRASAFACVFHGSTLKTFSKVINDPYFQDYLIDRKKWKDKNKVASVITYLQQVEASLKP